MKKYLILILLALPCHIMAQSEWGLPENMQKEAAQGFKKAKEPKNKIEPKYGVGTVPVVDGKVVWEKNIHVAGASAEAIYDRVLQALTSLTKQEYQRGESRIIAVNTTKHIIAAVYEEELEFSSKALSRDFTIFKYTIIAECKDGEANVKFCRVSYEYEKGRKGEATYRAEEWITDQETIKPNGISFYRANGKFRKKTIDRKDDVFSFIEQEITK